jgi:hypothetical protein
MIFRLLFITAVQEGHTFDVPDLVKRYGYPLQIAVWICWNADINHVFMVFMSSLIGACCSAQVYFKSDEVRACIVTCGGLCPGLNTVIREIVCGLYHMYGVTKVLGIDVSDWFLLYLMPKHGFDTNKVL